LTTTKKIKKELAIPTHVEFMQPVVYFKTRGREGEKPRSRKSTEVAGNRNSLDEKK
jgi:hypothetical protein